MAVTSLKAYYQLTKPGIIRGNVINTAAGFLLGSQWDFAVQTLLATLGGTALLIGSGCVFNNYIDRGIDARMARTKQRALASGAISVRNALIFGSLLGASGLFLLAHYTNALTVAIGLFGWVCYVIVYGVAKRRSVHGTLVGAVAGALPPVAGYTAATNQLDIGAWLLFLILVLWQMSHFYSIAMYRIKDYRAAGLPVFPIVHGMQAARRHILVYAAIFTAVCPLLTLTGYTGYVFALAMVGVGLYWIMKGVRGFGTPGDVAWAKGMFGVSLLVITTLAVMLSFGPILP